MSTSKEESTDYLITEIDRDLDLDHRVRYGDEISGNQMYRQYLQVRDRPDEWSTGFTEVNVGSGVSRVEGLDYRVIRIEGRDYRCTMENGRPWYTMSPRWSSQRRSPLWRPAPENVHISLQVDPWWRRMRSRVIERFLDR